jgi:hypothetical protein
MNIKQSELKIKEAFNNCPSGEQIKRDLDNSVTYYSFVDLDVKEYQFWQNEPDTLVILISKDNTRRILEVAKFALDWDADELHYIIDNNRIIIRMWWD